MKNPALVWMNFLKDGVNNGDPTAIGVVVAFIVVLFTIGNFKLDRFAQRSSVQSLKCEAYV